MLPPDTAGPPGATPAVEEALGWLAHRSWQGSRLGLARIEELLERLGRPQDALRFVHVAGTNGKSSVCAMLAAVLHRAGYRTGLYTSPYILHFNERMQINGVPIGDEALVALTAEVRRAADAMADHPTEFELVTALGMLHFARAACDIVVLEVGLGGRLDATNVIGTPALAVITALAIDHSEVLGDTLEAIAAEKGGIIKPGGLVLALPPAPGAQAVLEGLAAKVGARLILADLAGLEVCERSLSGQRFRLPGGGPWRIGLLGSYQPANAALVVRAAQALRGEAGLAIPDEAITAGLAEARWPARFEVLRGSSPALVVDGGHNRQGAEALAESLTAYFPGRKVVFVAGVMADKDYPAMFEALRPLAKAAVCVTPQNPRALEAAALAQHLGGAGWPGVKAAGGVPAGIHAALKLAGPDDVVCAFGSLYMAGEALETLRAL